jgi:superfamily II DNA/RNA helicase
MSDTIREQEAILRKLGIHQLNPMQEEAIPTIERVKNTILLSPTGTGKTLAFLLPIINNLDITCKEVQALILVPSRELAIQIEQVIRSMGSGYKVNAVYGGRPISKDKIELKHTPAILVGTPGRIEDHFRSDRFSREHIQTLVLDEFDKSLETGFESEMKAIVKKLPNLKKRILTSATQGVEIPEFVGLHKPKVISYLEDAPTKLVLKTIISPSKNKLKSLLSLLNYLGNQPGIVFCNLRESVQEVSDYLQKNNISHGCFSGGMEQKDRERTLIKFRNGTYQVIVATDLAARGIDIPELKYIIHYELPRTVQEFTHRNGRTARVNAKGTAYILSWEKEYQPDFIKDVAVETIDSVGKRKAQYWQTLFISGGRKDKISKGDVAGLFFKQGNLSKDQLGVIELKQDCTFVAVPVDMAEELVATLNNSRLKKKKVRITKV